MNNQYTLEGNFLTRKRGGLGDFYPVEIARYLHECKIGNSIDNGAKTNPQVYRRVARIFGIKVSTVKWCYMNAKVPFAGLSSER